MSLAKRIVNEELDAEEALQIAIEQSSAGSVEEKLRDMNFASGKTRELAQEIFNMIEETSSFVDGLNVGDSLNDTLLGSDVDEMVGLFDEWQSLAMKTYYEGFREAKGLKGDAPSTPGMWGVLALIDELGVSPTGSPSNSPSTNEGFTDQVGDFGDRDLIESLRDRIPSRLKNRTSEMSSVTDQIVTETNELVADLGATQADEDVPDSIRDRIIDELVPMFKEWNAWTSAAVWATSTSYDAVVSEILKNRLQAMGRTPLEDTNVKFEQQSIEDRPWVSDPDVRPFLPI